ncbi:MAG TPA: bifunctional DNA-binding transcriptional regulator/O6-methylguanine-DNA methyltransferase Ada [Acidobacteriaceae bacterium]|jgi:AraC family transcriptional regulator of adaptative response/methylated-DNA-[protein]-cysteine methyltransferase|nr:bifunctional DNA-binding transcriptional regulator/O6-methylguanine-DNA methyltransferase Ada [Acidobacteriaceae bacterium]
MATMSVVSEVVETMNDSAAWRKVLERDRSAGFVYAVTTTGVYCRPGCASRKPSRENVRFFESCEEAEKAGFRACLRCEPKRLSAKEDPRAEAVARAVKRLREADGEMVRLAELSQNVGVSRFVLLRAFRRVLGVTPAEFVRALRRERFRKEVRNPLSSVTDAVYAAGFGSSSRMYESAGATLGMRPFVVKNGGYGVDIRWTIAGSALGRMLVASTERGLCCVLFADTDTEAERELRERFAKAELRRDDMGLGGAVRFVLGEMSESATAASLPFDVRATAFQHRVWEALRAIPRGETLTYAEIARKIGAPKAVRAVGAACGANPLAVVVPCHRAVGSDGRLTGYRWGVERKRKLLEMERAAHSAE